MIDKFAEFSIAYCLTVCLFNGINQSSYAVIIWLP